MVIAIYKNRSTKTDEQSRLNRFSPGVYVTVVPFKDQGQTDIQIVVNGCLFLKTRADSILTVIDTSEELLRAGKVDAKIVEKSEESRTEEQWRLLIGLNEPVVTNSVKVDGFCETDTTEGEIKEYFVNFGSPILHSAMNRDEGCCIVSFDSCETARAVCDKRHQICGHDVNTRLYYQRPSSLTVSVDQRKLKFILRSTNCQDTFNAVLKLLFANIDWSMCTQDQQSITVTCNLDRSLSNFDEKVKFWSVLVSKKLFELVNSINSKSIEVLPEQLIVLEKAFKQLIENVHDRKTSVDLCSETNTVSVTGFNPFVDHELSKINKIIKRTISSDDMYVQTVDESSSKVYQGMFCFSKEQSEFLKTQAVRNHVSRQITKRGITCSIEYREDYFIIMLTSSIQSLSSMQNIMSQCASTKTIKYSPDMYEMLRTEIPTILQKCNGLVNVVLKDDNTLIVCATSPSAATAIEEYLKSVLQHQTTGLKGIAYYTCKSRHTISLLHGDITNLEADSIVCSSDRLLTLGIGVGRSLVEKGGKEIQDDCSAYLQTKPDKMLSPFEVFVSTAGQLKIKKVIHIPGNKWENQKDLLQQQRDVYIYLVHAALVMADKLQSQSVALPALCCGNNEHPEKFGTAWTVEAIQKYLYGIGASSSIQRLYLCDVKESVVGQFMKRLDETFCQEYKS